MKRIIFILVVISCVFIINNLVHSIYSLWQKQDVLVQAKQDLEKERRQNSSLKTELHAVKSPQFVEEQARDKLLLVKPGEDLVVVPTELIAGAQPKIVKQAPVRPNWQQWMDYFLQHAK
jgi:cell division protein DivIC